MAKKKVWEFQPRLPNGERLHLRFDSKAEKDAYIEEFKKKKKLIQYGYQQNFKAPDLKSYAAIWLQRLNDDVQRGELTLAGFDVFERHLRLYIIPKIGNISLDILSSTMIEQFLSELRYTIGRVWPDGHVTGAKAMSSAYRNRIRTTLYTMFERAVKDKVVPFNPVHGVDREDEESSRPPVTILHSDEEVKLWLDTAYKLGPIWGAFEMVLLNTGARKSQILALKWKDYDPVHRKAIWMGRMWEQISRSIVDRTKGRKKHESFWVGVNDALAKALGVWRKQSEFTDPEDYIFCFKKGKYLDPKSVELPHNRIREITGVDMTIHEGRHTYGSQYVAKGGGLEGAQEQLGHKSKSTTEKYYKHHVRADLSSRANVLNLAPSKPIEAEEKPND